jgi:hypothetical protein
MGLIPDAVVNLVVTIAFAIYAVMGLAFFITGIVYMGDAGAIGATGMYLIFLGLIMLIIGGIATWANQNSNWMVLFIIELFNVALFLVRLASYTPCSNGGRFFRAHVCLCVGGEVPPRQAQPSRSLPGDWCALTVPVHHDRDRPDDGDRHHRPGA